MLRECENEQKKQLLEEYRWRDNLGVHETSFINIDFGGPKSNQYKPENTEPQRKSSQQVLPYKEKADEHNDTFDQSGLPLEKVE